MRLADGHRFVKRVMHGPGRGLYNLESWNAGTIEGVRVELGRRDRRHGLGRDDQAGRTETPPPAALGVEAAKPGAPETGGLEMTNEGMRIVVVAIIGIGLIVSLALLWLWMEPAIALFGVGALLIIAGIAMLVGALRVFQQAIAAQFVVAGLLLIGLSAVVRSVRGEIGQRKRCPRCAEVVRARARMCRFCGHEFAPPATEPY